MLTSLQRCHLWVENLDKLIMIYKDWPSDAWLDCKLVDGTSWLSFLWLKTSCWKKMKICLKMHVIWKRENFRWGFLMLDDLRWATYLLRFCTQILYMALLYKALHLTFFPSSKFLLVCFSMHNVCLMCWLFFLLVVKLTLTKKPPKLILRSRLIFGPLPCA